MSATLTTATMITRLVSRVPIGCSRPYWLDLLNDQFRRICQMAAFSWNVKKATVTVAGTSFSLPTDCDPGAPMSLVGPTGWKLDIPYFSWEKASSMDATDQTVSPGQFGAWAVQGTTAFLFPTSATIPNASMTLYYHSRVATPLTDGAVYFPSPDEFDVVLIDMAEAEAKRNYRISGWENAEKRAQASLVPLLDRYRSTKQVLAGLAEQGRQTQEIQMKRAEG